jgi:signal transduction histidine kinase
LLLGIIAGTAVLLTIFSILIYTMTRQKMIRHFDQSLLATARMLSAVAEEESKGDESESKDNDKPPSRPQPMKRSIDFEFDVRMTPEFNTINGGAYYQIWSADGKTLVRSPSLGDQNLDYFESVLETPDYQNTILPDGMPGRAISYCLLPKQENESDAGPAQNRILTLVLAQSAAELYTHLRFLKWLLAASSLGVVCLSAGIAFGVTRTGLRPVNSLAQKIDAVGQDNLGQVFHPSQYPVELWPICTRLNDAFRRLEKSFARERQFNADVAHELRTPLAGIQSTLEVCLFRNRESAEYRQAMEDCLQITRTMNKLIDTFLLLSKVDSGQIAFQMEDIPVGKTIDRIWQCFTDKARDKRIIFENTVLSGAVGRSDKDHLGTILLNVLENAVAYTDPGGRIWAAADRDGDQIRLRISNTGCTLTKEDAEQVFDFFWRKSSSRTDAGSHCGIGLSVARKMAEALGISIEIDVHEGVFTVYLTIPQ